MLQIVGAKSDAKYGELNHMLKGVEAKSDFKF